MRNLRPALIAALVVFLAIVFIVYKFPISPEKKEELKTFISGEDTPVEITTDYEGAKISPEKLLKKCVNRECIPSIDNPAFESVEQADTWLKDSDTVFGLDYNGLVRAYPKRIMSWHEIVNDQFAEIPVAVTFCPLSGASTAFIRKVNDKETEFGMSPYIYNSNMIMYDRKTGNLWQQINYEAIVGDAARRNEFLQWINIADATWGEWKAAHPDTEVLKRPDNSDRDYDRYPYGSYEENTEIRFGASDSDKRLHPKDVIYGVKIANTAKAYLKPTVELAGTFEDNVGGVSILVEKAKDGSLVITNEETGDELLTQRAFWFVWSTFNPNTPLN